MKDYSCSNMLYQLNDISDASGRWSGGEFYDFLPQRKILSKIPWNPLHKIVSIGVAPHKYSRISAFWHCQKHLEIITLKIIFISSAAGKLLGIDLVGSLYL